MRKKLPIQVKIEKRAPVQINKEMPIKPPYDEMLQNLELHKKELTEENYQLSKGTIEGFYKLFIYQNEILEFFKTHNEDESTEFVFDKIGILMHAENLGQRNSTVIIAPNTLVTVFQNAKEKNTLLKFFQEAFYPEQANCVEIRNEHLSNWFLKNM